MAKISAIKPNVTLNSVAIEDELTSGTLNLKQETTLVSGISSVGPERVVGNYDFNFSGDGNSDFATSQGDATIFAMLASAGVALAVDPTGNTAAAGDPNYDSTVVLDSYAIKFAVGGAVNYTVSLLGASALTRAVA